MRDLLLVSILTIVSMQYLISSYVAPPDIPKRPTYNELKNSLLNSLQPKDKNNTENNKSKNNPIKKSVRVKVSGKE